MIHVSSKTAAALASDYDCYGDSYYEDTNEEKLEKVFQKIENSVGTFLQFIFCRFYIFKTLILVFNFDFECNTIVNAKHVT